MSVSHYSRAAFVAVAAASLAGCGVNTVPTAEENAKAKWGDVQAAFQERANLIPNLAEVVKASGEQEKAILTGVVVQSPTAVKHVVLMGETSTELAFHCSAFRIEHTICVTLAEAVRRASELARAGDNVLLSPGFASFDMFRGYADRGEQFEQLVRELKTAASFG